jgi:hypothetical protein
MTDTTTQDLLKIHFRITFESTPEISFATLAASLTRPKPPASSAQPDWY